MKLIVSNFVTLDGFYEGTDRHDMLDLFRYRHPDYAGDDQFDHYNTELLGGASALLLAGRESYLGNQQGVLVRPWRSATGDPDSSGICPLDGRNSEVRGLG